MYTESLLWGNSVSGRLLSFYSHRRHRLHSFIFRNSGYTMSYSWFRSSSCFFFVFACICMNPAFSKPKTDDDPYSKHCSSLLPPPTVTTRGRGESLPSLSTPYFTGGDRFLHTEPGRTYYYAQRNIRLRLRPDYHQTTAAGVYEVDGSLNIRFPYTADDNPSNHSRSGYNRRARGTLRFPMNGFWSEKSRKLCMVGSASWKGTDLDAVLKLKFDDENPTIYTGVVGGSLESTAASANDPAYFDPILIFSFPPVPNYSYSLVSEETGAVLPSRKADSLSLDAIEFCSVMERGLGSLELEYAAECTGRRSPPHGCSPVGSDEYLPRFLSLNSIQCPEGEKKARFVAKFLNYSSYGFGYDGISLGSTVIGEAQWDEKNNRIIGVACPILNPSLQLGKFVGDCSIRLSVRLPTVLTIQNDAKIVGEIMSSKSVKELKEINFSSSGDYGDVVALPEQRYEYGEMERVRKWCTKTKAKAKKGNVYPDGQSYDMRFDMNIKNGKGKEVGWASATPVWVENDPYQNGNGVMIMESDDAATVISEPEKRDTTSPTKMSYRMRIHPYYHVSNSSNNMSSPTSSLDWPETNFFGGVEITAEGVYDDENGHLCMVGCRKLVDQNSTTTFKDCEVVLEFDVPPLNGKRGVLAKGVLKSMRPKTDAHHFDDLVMEFAAYYRGEAQRSIWRMDLEIAMVLVSSTFFCIFVALQIFHVKKNPEAGSFVSLAMVVVLTVGSIILLVLNFEAVFLGERDKKTLQLGSGGKLEANEIAVRVITLVALLLLLRLLQLVYTAKQSDNNGKKAGFVSVSLYILGCLLTLLVNWIMKTYVGRRYSVWGDLRSYAGLILDGFLLPQIVLNVLRGSAEKALCRSFYIGTSAVRLVPHAYDQYRAHNYPKYEVNTTYYYANPAADLYSTAWDIIIPCGIIALAVIVFLQQRKGGRCILPQRFRALEMYDKVPTTDNP